MSRRPGATICRFTPSGETLFLSTAQPPSGIPGVPCTNCGELQVVKRPSPSSDLSSTERDLLPPRGTV